MSYKLVRCKHCWLVYACDEGKEPPCYCSICHCQSTYEPIALNAEKAHCTDDPLECPALKKFTREKAERCPEIEFVYGKEASAKGQGITLMYHKELRTIIAFKPKHKGLAKDSFDEGKLSTSGVSISEGLVRKDLDELIKNSEEINKLAHAIKEKIDGNRPI